MLDNGYSLHKIELYNWGNFHGQQRFVLNQASMDGPLFAPPSASAILGINGSGKSTLIDGLMIVLLPFEGSVKLGVTNDLESGGSGGRTIRDYVLGKHSSTGGAAPDRLEDIYGRREGCSIFLLEFRHNKFPDRRVTVGRIWWFQNYKVNDTQIAFLNYDSLKIADLCPEGKLPRSPKLFRDHVKKTLPSLNTFDTMQAYFLSLSSTFGQISRDDLKILNRAFFVKSISHIDQFIRENMLIEHETPHLERLLENVRNGKEIDSAIQHCEAKISAIDKILSDLTQLLELSEKKQALELDLDLLILFQPWTEIRGYKRQLSEHLADIQLAQSRLPKLEFDLQTRKAALAVLRAQIAQDNIELRVQQLQAEAHHLQQRVNLLKDQKSVSLARAKRLVLDMPVARKEWPQFHAHITRFVSEVEGEITEKGNHLEKMRMEKYMLDQEAVELKAEIQHLTASRTLLPSDLYAIKREAEGNLKLAPGRLLFVGELIQVRGASAANRRPIESVLFPIAKNLLCHPEDLNRLAKWLDAKGLRSDVTVKRISHEELSISIEPGPFAENQILGMIEILPREQHPFTDYLWKWLHDVFDYQLVEVNEFKSQNEKLVTLDGLVKADRRTMRKLKANFSYQLGWDNQETISELTHRLVRLQNRHTQLMGQLNSLTGTMRILEDKREFLTELHANPPIFLDLADDEATLRELNQEAKALEKNNPEFQNLKTQLETAEKIYQTLSKEQIVLQTDFEQKSRIAKNLEHMIPSKERELTESLLYAGLMRQHDLEQLLSELEARLVKENQTRMQYESSLREKREKLELRHSRIVSASAVAVNQYRQTFNDPNLPYEIDFKSGLDKFITEWQKTLDRLKLTELPTAKEKWRKFFDQVLMDSIKDTINEIKSRLHEIERNIRSINEVLTLTNFEDLPDEQRYLKIDYQLSADDRIRKFRNQMGGVEKLLGPMVRLGVESQSAQIMSTLMDFVEGLKSDANLRLFVTDVRNHFQFRVHSLRRMPTEDIVVETFTGSRKDAKSSAQTTQLAYTLLASCLAYRFKFHDPVLGQDTPRLLILDEFGGKFDNEKPREILKLLDKMGFQAILVSPMSKADLLAESISQLILVYKVSASRSKVESHEISTKQDYLKLLELHAGTPH